VPGSDVDSFRDLKERVLPPPLPGIERVPSLRVLGVTVNHTLTAADHVTTLVGGVA